MTTTENNKLIAEFMEPEFAKRIPGLIDGSDEDGIELEGSMWVKSCMYMNNYSNIGYEKKWDRLMPVVEKIESLYYAVIITQNTCTIQASIIGDKTVVSKQISNYGEDNTKLSNTYKAVVEFIIWYNKIKSHEKRS